MLAVKTARDWARTERPQIERPNLVLPDSAHPAFVKAAETLGIKVVRAAPTESLRADPDALADLVDSDTVMLVGSAPPYPIGLVDPIADIARLGAERGLWVHVDACVGGFVLPFAEDLGEPVPCFDFRNDGVTSMSADLHKYGYANRGSSVLALRSRELHRHQRFSNGDWPGGTYTSLGFAGSRPSGPVASAWAVMRYLGTDGYRERVRGIIEAKRRFTEVVEGTGALEVIGEPEGGNISVTSRSIDMTSLGDVLETRGWRFGRLRRPPGLVLLMNYRHSETAETFAEDLAAAIADDKAGRFQHTGDDAVYVG